MTEQGIAAALREVVEPRDVLTDPDLLESYRRDQAATVEAGTPVAVVRARSADDVKAVLRIAAGARIPVVTRGAGSGLSGGANAVDGCIVLSTELMRAIVEIDAANQLARVQPGVLNRELREAAAEVGLTYPPDPASYEFSTLGGNIATNAGGLCCVKYGVTRDYVLGLEVVLANGDVLRTGRRTRKGVAGYDVTALFVGSEGTLGVITEATLRLKSPASPPATLAAFFSSLPAAGEAVAAIIARSTPSLLEVMDRTTINAVEDFKPMDLDRDAEALLIAQSDAGLLAAEEIARIHEACEQAGASLVAHSVDPSEAEAMLAARRLAFPALERLGDILLDDVAVPCSRIPELLARIGTIAEKYGLVIGTFGHAGDGNMHPTIVFDRRLESSRLAAQNAFDEIVRAALALDGTITGEHGVGILKRAYLAEEIGATGMTVHQSIKGALDPLGILNPGKVI